MKITADDINVYRNLKCNDEDEYSNLDILCESVGMEAAAELISEYGGSVLYIPRPETISKPNRDIQIKQAFSKGSSIRQLARKYFLTERAIYGIVTK